MNILLITKTIASYLTNNPVIIGPYHPMGLSKGNRNNAIVPSVSANNLAKTACIHCHNDKGHVFFHIHITNG